MKKKHPNYKSDFTISEYFSKLVQKLEKNIVPEKVTKVQLSH